MNAADPRGDGGRHRCRPRRLGRGPQRGRPDPDDPEVVERLLERDPGALLVAEAGGQVVGVLIAGWDGWRGNVYRLAVLPSHRRQGIARQLVEAGHERLRAQGAHRVTALVGGEEGAAHRLWRAVGYQRDEFVHRFVRNL